MTVLRPVLFCVVLGALTASAVSGQSPPPPASPRAGTAEVDPLECWWRTSAGAVRVGESFSVVLTCSVVETESLKVVPDQSRIDPTVMQLEPFEVLGGAHAPDLRTEDHRFFQYEYRLRLISENQFGKDVLLPPTRITYRIQTRVGDGAAIDSRDHNYMLPQLPIRILSLVPADATDIRDSATETFADVDARDFRLNALRITGGVLFTLAGLSALLALVRLFGRFRGKPVVTDRLIADPIILRGAGRELAAVQRERDASGWTPELAARALGAIRIAASYALARRISQLPAKPGEQSDAGALTVRGGWLGGKRVTVSGSVTAQNVALALAGESRTDPGSRQAADLEELERALSRFNAAQYGRGVGLDDAALDESLALGVKLLRRLRTAYTWPMRKLTAMRQGTRAFGSRVWSR